MTEQDQIPIDEIQVSDEDWLPEFNRILSETWQLESAEDMYSRGIADDELVENLITGIGLYPPAMRANIYITIAAMAVNDPTVVNDAELILYSFAVHDRKAMEAVKDGEVVAIDAYDEIPEGVVVDPDWYNDQVHHDGNVNLARGFLEEQFGAGTVPQPDYQGETVFGTGYTHSQPDKPDALALAIRSGLMRDDRDWGEVFDRKGSWEKASDVLFEAMDMIGAVSSVIAPVVALGSASAGAAPSASGRAPGIRPGGVLRNRPVVPAVGNQPAVTLSNEAAFRNGQALTHAWTRATGTAQSAHANLPAFMKPFSYASTRVGQPINRVIAQSAATARRNNSPNPVRILDRMTHSRITRNATIGASLVFGSQAMNAYLNSQRAAEVQQGRDQMEQERLERSEAIAAEQQAAAQREADIMAEEQRRRAESRAMHSNDGGES